MLNKMLHQFKWRTSGELFNCEIANFLEWALQVVNEAMRCDMMKKEEAPSEMTQFQWTRWILCEKMCLLSCFYALSCMNERKSSPKERRNVHTWHVFLNLIAFFFCCLSQELLENSSKMCSFTRCSFKRQERQKADEKFFFGFNFFYLLIEMDTHELKLHYAIRASTSVQWHLIPECSDTLASFSLKGKASKYTK